MTPDELIHFIKKGPTDALVSAVAPLAEPQRKKLSGTVVKLRKERSRYESAKAQRRVVAAQQLQAPPVPCPFCGRILRSPVAQQCFECGKDWHDVSEAKKAVMDYWHPQSEARLKLALLALGPWGEAQRIRVWQVAPHWDSKNQDLREFLFLVLKDRKPDWLEKWVDKELDREHFADWDFARRLIRAEICAKPQHENYTLKMVHGMYSLDRKRSLKDRLLEDPSLLADEVWRIFELSPARATILDSTDITYNAHADLPSYSWSQSLRALAADGKLDRQRLLAASLGSLLRNNEARNVTWFYKFHEVLEPTDVERQSLQASYLQLLSHPVPAVVGMALDALVHLEKARKLDQPRFLDAVVAVFHLQPKAQPLAALKILGRLGGRHAGQAAKLAEVLLSGLTHPAAQVQQGIVDLLARLGDGEAAVIATTLPSQIETLAPSVQAAARKLLVGHASSVPNADVGSGDDLIREAHRVPSPWREQAGIDNVLHALEGAGELMAVQFDPMCVPHLDPEQRVQPIRTLDELIERLTVAVEGLQDPIEFELLLDGLSRLCDQRPDDLAARVAPMLHRIKKALPSHIAIPQGLQTPLFKLILRWCDQEVPDSTERGDSILGFLERRMGFLSLRLRKRQAAPLLACPTHRRGWIDAEAMAERLAWYAQRGMEPSTHDVIQGLLRLAPDGREEILARFMTLEGKFAAAFRYSLRGPLEETSLSPAVLIAAGRALAPIAELVELHAVGGALGPDASNPARYSFEFIEFDRLSQTPTVRLVVNVQPANPSPDLIRDLPTVLIHSWRATEGQNRWVGTVWPANLQAFFASGARLRQSRFLDVHMSRQRADFLEPLLDPDIPFTEMAQLLLSLALNQAEPEVTGLAVDVLIELIRDGRCVGPELGSILRSVLQGNVVKLNRLAKHLDTASRASQLHAYVCAQIIQTALAGVNKVPNDLHCLLSPLLEWLTALEQPVLAAFRPILEKALTGKTGALARRLLKLNGPPGKHNRFLTEALEGRLQRARRWSAGSRP